MSTCHSCRRPILSKSIEYNQQSFHPECFTCKKCGLSLSGVSFMKDKQDNPTCVTCFNKTAPRCYKCAQLFASGISYKVLGENMFYHQECFVCSGPCRKPISGQYIKTKNGSYMCKQCNDINADRCDKCGQLFSPGIEYTKLNNGICYHRECFVCSGPCRKPLTKHFFTNKSGQYVCKECHDINANRCKKCRRTFEPGVSYKTVNENEFYHQECFLCSGPCNKPINREFFRTKAGGILCKECSDSIADRCHKCGLVFSAGVTYRTLTNGFNFHIECFVCSGPCQKPISSEFYRDKEDKYICKQCRDLTADRCRKCGNAFVSGVSYKCIRENEFYHKECFVCSGSCRQPLVSEYFLSNEDAYFCRDCFLYFKQTPHILTNYTETGIYFIFGQYLA